MDLSVLPTTVLSAAKYAAYLVIPYCMALSIYRLLFHSLRKYPGPVTARMSSLYAAFYAFRTDLHLKAWQNHANYGPVVRQGPNRLVFNSFNALRDIYQNERITKSRAYLVSQRAPGAYGLFNAIDRHLHQKKRKLLGPVVNDRSIRTFEPTMIDQIDIFIRQLLLSCQKEPLAPINMTKRFSYLTMDIMGYFVFGYPLDLQTEATNRFMIDATPNFFLNVALQLPVLGSIRLSNYRYLRVLLRGSKYRNTLRKMIRNRLAEGEDVKSSLLFMTDSLRVSENDDIFIEEIRSEATFLLSAGSDTMSTWLSALFFYLSRNQECYQRLTREIRGAFRCASEIQSGPRLANCYYLRSCLDETLRMSPPIPGTLWRKQVDDDNGQAEPLIIDGHHIPSGTEVGVNIYSLHHNEEYFPEPFTFRPERFLADGLEAGKVSKDGFAPFSLGARGCIGKSMAYQEASLIVAKTLWYFDFEKAQGSAGKLGEVRTKDAGSRQERAGEYQIYDVFGAAHDGPCLSFRPREDYVKELVEGVKRID